MGFPGGSGSKESACNARNWIQSPGQEDPLEKELSTHFITLAWRIHGHKSLAGYSPWFHKELDMTK